MSGLRSESARLLAPSDRHRDATELVETTGGRHVKFRSIEQACAEVLTYQVTRQQSTDYDEDEEEHFAKIQGASESPTLSFCQRCCPSILRVSAPVVDEEVAPTKFSPRSAYTWMEVALWKLNSNVDLDVGGKKILNWRRRYFYLQEYESRLALTYTSEKENGSLHLGCIISERGVSLTERQVLPRVTLDAMDKDSKAKLMLSMKEYDLAFSCEQTRDFYEDTCPQELFPFRVDWSDRKGKKRHMVLASLSEAVPTQVVDYIANVTKRAQSEVPA